MIKQMVSMALLAGCGVCLGQKPGEPAPEALKAGIQAGLDKEKPACVALFAKNDPTGHLMLKASRGMTPTPKLDVYYAHGLVVRQDTRVSFSAPSVIPMTSSLSKRKNAWRYDWAPKVTSDVVDDELCYGFHPVVDSVSRWTEPQNGSLTAEYTWHFERVADWAKKDWLEHSDPDVFAATSKKEQTGHTTLTLFNDGWH